MNCFTHVMKVLPLGYYLHSVGLCVVYAVKILTSPEGGTFDRQVLRDSQPCFEFSVLLREGFSSEGIAAIYQSLSSVS